MTNKMIVRLTNDLQTPVEWLTVDEKNNPISDVNQSECEVYVLVPGNDIFLTEVKLPKLSQTQLMKAIPFALEELLAEDSANLHFAPGTKLKDGMLPVAVVSKKKMDAWKSRLDVFFRSQTPNLKVLLPEPLALPWKPDQWTIFIDKSMALVRTGAQAGFTVEVNELWNLLRLFFKKSNVVLPKTIVIIGDLTIPSEEAMYFKQFDLSFKHQSQNNLLALMAETTKHPIAMNLYQGPYKTRHYFTESKIFSRRSAVLAAMWLFVLILGFTAQFSILKYQEYRLHTQIMGSFKQISPGVASVDNSTIKRRTQQILQSLKKTQTPSAFLTIINNIAPVLAEEKSIKLLGLEYGANQLTLIVEANNFLLIDKVNQALKKQNYKIEVNEAKKSENHIRAHIIIREIT